MHARRPPALVLLDEYDASNPLYCEELSEEKTIYIVPDVAVTGWGTLLPLNVPSSSLPSMQTHHGTLMQTKEADTLRCCCHHRPLVCRILTQFGSC